MSAATRPWRMPLGSPRAPGPVGTGPGWAAYPKVSEPTAVGG